jgi:hypothetical protein
MRRLFAFFRERKFFVLFPARGLESHYIATFLGYWFFYKFHAVMMQHTYVELRALYRMVQK